MPQLEKNTVRPAESIHVLSVSDADVCLRGSRHDIIFFSNRMVASKIFQDHRQEFNCDTVGIGIVSVATQAFQGEEVDGGPAIRIIPLGLAFKTARGDSAWMLEPGEMCSYGFCLFFRRESGPQRIERCRILIGRLFVG